MKVYLIHQKILKNRINNIINLLLSCDSIEDIEIITSESSKLKFSTIDESKHVLPEGFPTNLISNIERSVYHKHFRAFQKIADRKTPAIILEDDAIFDPQKFDRFIKECDMLLDFDWCFFGKGCNLKLSGNGFIKNNNMLKSKCADSMLIHHEAAQIVYDDLINDKAYAAVDWDLNYRFLKHNFTVYWYEPGFVSQGSEDGTYQTCHNRQ